LDLSKDEDKNDLESFKLPERHSSLVKVHVNNEEKTRIGRTSNSMINLKSAADYELGGGRPYSISNRLRDRGYSTSRNSSVNNVSSLRNECTFDDDSSSVKSRRSSVNTTSESIKRTTSLSQISVTQQPIALHSKFIGDDLDSFDCKLFNLLTNDPYFPERTHFPHGNESLIPPLPNDRYFQSIKNNLDITRITGILF